MLERLFTFGARRRLVCTSLLTLLTLISVNGIAKLRIDTNYDNLMSAHDPAFPAYERTIEEFGSDNTTIIYLRDEHLFSPDRLRQIEALVSALSDLEPVERVDSLFSARNIRDRDGILEAGALLETTPEDPGEMARIRDNALYSPLLTRLAISEDGQVTAVTVTVRRDRHDQTFNRRFFQTVQALIEPLRDEFDEVFQIGPPRVNVEIGHAMFRDLRRLMPLSTVILVGTVLFLLRTGMAAALPLITAALSIVWTLGFMGYCGVPLTLMTALVPSMLLVIGSAEDTHMLTEYLQAIAGGGQIDRHRAIHLMARKIAVPITLNSFTTVLGFFANVFNDIVLIQGFAYATSFGMAASFVATVLFLPLAVSFYSPKSIRLAPEHTKPRGMIGVLVDALDHLRTRYRRAVVVITLAVVVVFGALAMRVRVSNDPLSYFKPANPLVKDAETVRRDLAGMSVFFFTLEAQGAGAFKRPEALRKIEAIVKVLADQGFDKTTSLTDFLALVNREMHHGDPDFFRVPDRQDLVEQYLLLFQREDLERYVSHDYRVANLVVRHHFSDSHTLNGKLARLRQELPTILGDDITYRLAGENLMINHAAESLYLGEVLSLGVIIGVIFLIMSVMYTSALGGVVSLIPNLIPIVIVFGVMALLGIPLNPGTACVAVIALGISVDDTTHLLSRYNMELKHTADAEEALRLTIWGEAVPVIATAVSLASGFAILVISDFAIVAQYGFLAALTMLIGVLTDLTMTPLLLKQVRLVGIWEIVGFKLGRDVLYQNRIFEGLSPFQIKKAILLSELVTVPKGQDIFTQGSRGRSMYLILLGTAEVWRVSGARAERIATLGRGEVFGEVGYTQEIERTATVRTSGEATLLRLDFPTVQKALRWYPAISSRLNLNISRVLGERLAQMHARTAHLSLTDVQS